MSYATESGISHYPPESVSSENTKEEICKNLSTMVREQLFLADPEKATLLFTEGKHGIAIDDFPSSDVESAWNISLIQNTLLLRRFRREEELLDREVILLDPERGYMRTNPNSLSEYREQEITQEKMPEVRSLIQTIAQPKIAA